MLEIKFTKSAEKDFEFWCTSDRKTAQKIVSLLEEMAQTHIPAKVSRKFSNANIPASGHAASTPKTASSTR